MSISILISTVPYDIHAGAVSIACEAHGKRAVRWYPSAFPLCDALSFSITANGQQSVSLKARNHSASFNIPYDHIDTFWYRRQGLPVVSNKLHHADKALSEKSSERMIEMMICHLHQQSKFQVNNYQSAHIVERSKYLQLQIAIACGFKCPETLITNSPKEIVDFINSSGGTIFKSFNMPIWKNAVGIASGYTAQVALSDLPSDELLSTCPGIFQREIEKEFELRVTVMGQYAIAAKLNSQEQASSRTDWRVEWGNVKVEEYILPKDIYSKCIRLVERLNLVFGCIDLIVSKNGDFIFLEVNQMGQFLWLEENEPTIPLLDTFTQFLLSKNPKFEGPTKSHKASLSEIVNDARALMKDDLRQYQHLELCQDRAIIEN